MYALRILRTHESNQLLTPITVCIPAYRSKPWIETTLQSLESQTLQDFKVVISVDGDDRATFEFLRPLLKESKYQIYLQKRHLGWVGNTNWLLRKARTPYVCILPHDDLFHSFYLEELYRHLMRRPECLLVYTDTQLIGPDTSFKRRYYAQPSVKGSVIERMESYLLYHLNAPGFRGLMQRKVIKIAGLIQENPFDNFAADTNWIGKIAMQGEIHRIPIPLCTKRYHTKNTHTKWLTKTKAEQLDAWAYSCQELFKTFSYLPHTPEDQKKLKEAAEKRFQQGCLRFRLR